jgi:hypothetical protein
MQPLPLKQSILQTLAFFDVFHHGLTLEEVQTYLWRGGVAEKNSTNRALHDLVQAKLIRYDRGYYGLTPTANKRIIRIPHIEHKQQIAITAAKKLRYVPFVRAVFVCNNLALGTVHADSDVDVCIVTRSGRIWIARLLATVLLRLMRIARTRYTSVDKVCLSFYVTDSALDMSGITLGTPDIYLMYWVRSLVPLYDPYNHYSELQKKNTWITPYIRMIQQKKLSSRIRVDLPTGLFAYIPRICEQLWRGRLGDIIELQAKELQKTKMKFRFESIRDEPDSRVIVSDDMLKFHENDRRVQYREAWEERVIKHDAHNMCNTGNNDTPQDADDT